MNNKGVDGRMKELLSGNIARYRKELGLTQDELASRLGITFQAVSKWETGQTMPDITLIPKLCGVLRVSTDRLLGYAEYEEETPIYEQVYRKDEYFWGTQPSMMCLKILELMPPIRPLRLLDIGCGEGKDAVFMARCGYDVSDFDILYSSGVLHYIKPELRHEIIANYRAHTKEAGLHAFHVFVEKPFIAPAPEYEPHSYKWLSGQLFTYYHDWYIEQCTEYVFDCNSSGIPHKHAANKLFARKCREGFL